MLLLSALGLFPAIVGLQGPAVALKEDVLAAHLDRSVDPGVDFFAYANGGWLKRNPIPPTESSWGVGNGVDEDLYAQLRRVDEKAAGSGARPGSDLQKIGDFWRTGMDTAKADRLGRAPLRTELRRIDAIRTPSDAVSAAFALQSEGVDALFSFDVSQDEKRSDVMAVHLGQGGLGLPNRDFYVNPEAGVAKVRAAYVKHLARVLAFAGGSDASAEAERVMAFETSLARASRKLAELRDPIHNYNPRTLAELTRGDTPHIAWGTRLADWGLRPDRVVVGQPEFYRGLDALLVKTPLPTLREYLRVRLVDRYAPYLNATIERENFDFYHTVLSGQKQPRPRWKRVIDAENGTIGFVLGRQFVHAYFPPAAKRRYEDLTEAVRTAYRERIERLDWMSPETKAKALDKLSRVTKKVGYPDHWKDQTALRIGRASYCDNVRSAERWRFHDMVAKYGKPVDRTEWGMTPQTYNAYYNPSNNEVVLPAASFAVPGLKVADLDDATIYGYTAGNLIGHEITHGFDDEGRQFDAKGNLRDWWTPEDARRFNERAQLMVKEFDAYEPLPGLHINGAASLGENIADYGGVLIGLDAFKKTAQYREGKPIAGLTPLQRYFLAYALGWMDQTREASLRRQLLSDVHAPAKWRVLGPLSNVPEFYKAFGIKPGQPMWRPEDQRVHIW